IPVLLLSNGGLYKTVRFKNPNYVGDPINTVKIFNEKGADEIVLLDISASREGKSIDFGKIAEIAGEAFMPMAYGGGIRSLEDAKKVFDAGYEKIVLNTIVQENPRLITEVANVYGSQSVVISIDAKPGWMGRYRVYTRHGSKNTGLGPAEYAKQVQDAGAGEIFIQAIDKDGTWEGYDIPLIKTVSSAVKVPVIACGGAANMDDLIKACKEGGASAVAAGSMLVYQKKGMGVLINFPTDGLKV
ncbi:MAG TPA: AglZ/HisF2 family acetamidino modification protein, partial [Puia sp.]|nr:AglZ/HisF2 family acetamidino modification protein [Puia sp.]